MSDWCVMHMAPGRVVSEWQLACDTRPTSNNVVIMASSDFTSHTPATSLKIAQVAHDSTMRQSIGGKEQLEAEVHSPWSIDQSTRSSPVRKYIL